MRIAVVTTFYSEGMGYTENCLPKALAELGHEVDVVTSNLNVYGNEKTYEETYAGFLGAADQGTGQFHGDGYTVHRLRSSRVGGYVAIRGLAAKIRQLKPEIVHCTEIAALHTFQLAALRPILGFRLFTETHQHLSVVRSYVKDPNGSALKKFFYTLTRTVPTSVSSLAVEKCYAISPDCVLVARNYYGVPHRKLSLRPLGTDTNLFHPAATQAEIAGRRRMRSQWGYRPTDILCIYTGRFSEAKNPLVLARAVENLAGSGLAYHSLFVGAGGQKEAIAHCTNATVVPFATHRELARLYQMADVAVWPREESMSMLDAAATGLPVVVSEHIGENDRVVGNGRVYKENDVGDLACVLSSLSEERERRSLGAAGRAKMLSRFSWTTIARSIVADFELARKK
jgi:glycosyltransferase involved in cell wall biosynthesis